MLDEVIIDDRDAWWEKNIEFIKYLFMLMTDNYSCFYVEKYWLYYCKLFKSNLFNDIAISNTARKKRTEKL